MTSDPTVTRLAPSPTGIFSLVTTVMAVVYPASARVARSRTRSRVAVVRRPRNQDRPIRGHALTFEAQQRIGKQCSGTDYALRLDLARALALAGPIEWVDEEEDGPHRKLADPAALDDVVLARKDVPTSYHLAFTADDAIQGVTLVTRGGDLATATHVHRVLQALGLPTPRYRHHELMTDAAGRRLFQARPPRQPFFQCGRAA